MNDGKDGETNRAAKIVIPDKVKVPVTFLKEMGQTLPKIGTRSSGPTIVSRAAKAAGLQHAALPQSELGSEARRGPLTPPPSPIPTFFLFRIRGQGQFLKLPR